MVYVLPQIAQPFSFDNLQQLIVANHAIGRLLVAAFLGALVGVEREINRKAAGVRTNLLICLGCAFFTLLSAVLAGDANPDKGRVASNIVQGIGFLGAGLILHNRSRVSGLTSAASVFVVASIGMACGAGLYAAEPVATVIVIAALEVVGFLERRANLKIYSLVYEARGADQTRILASILSVTDSMNQRLTGVENSPIGELQRVSFSLTTSKRQHTRLREKLLTEPGINALFTYLDPEED
jgi:putative Mg2+ transporter-C (MgtC) family protein